MQPGTLRRNTERANYDASAIGKVFSESFLAHVSYVDDGLPQCLPMIALFETEDDGNSVVFLHGYPGARLMELVRKQQDLDEAKDVKENGETDGELKQSHEQTNGSVNEDGRVRVCITATKVDGLCLSSAPNGHTFNYRSSVVHGSCSLVTDKPLKRRIMESVTNHIVSGRWDEVNPVSSFQVSLVCVIRVDVNKASLKQRKGPPGIQPRLEKDGPSKDYPIWTGVIPLWEQLGEPVESGLTPEAKFSKNLVDFTRERNERHKSHAEGVAKPEIPVQDAPK